VSSPKRGPDLAIWLILAGFAILAAGIMIGLPAFLRSQEPYRFHGSHYYDSKVAPDFELIGHHGKPVRLKDFTGKMVLLEFGFTHCPNICPMELANTAAFYRKLTPEEREKVQVLFVTVDPERDTVEVLRDYVPFFDESFIGLTGTPEQIEAVKKEYGVYAKQVPIPGKDDDYTVDHSAHMYILDPQHRLRVTYDHDRLGDAGPILEDIRYLLNES